MKFTIPQLKSSINPLNRQNLYVMLSINLLYHFIRIKVTSEHQKKEIAPNMHLNDSVYQ